MNRIALTAIVLSFSSSAWAGPAKSGTLELLRGLSPLTAVEPPAPRAVAVAGQGDRDTQASWSMREAELRFASGQWMSADLAGTWSRVARVSNKHGNGGLIDMRGLDVDGMGGRITFSYGKNPLQSGFIYADIQQETDGPRLADDVDGGQKRYRRIDGKATESSRRTYFCVTSGSEIVLCNIVTTGSSESLLNEYYAYARLK